MPPPSEREIIHIFWPMTIPPHAKFLITSPILLRASYPHNVSFTLSLHTPMHLSSPAPVRVMPCGVLARGFARGWAKLPVELKQAILRFELVYPSALWPRDANRVVRETLLHYLRMTPEIAGLARGLFFAENRFVVLPLQEELTMFRGFPPVCVRPLIRRVALFTWLEDGDRETIEGVAEKRFGFQGLVHVEIRCSVVRLVRLFLLERGLGADSSADEWSAWLSLRLPPVVRFASHGTLEFDRVEFARGCTDGKLVELVEQVEEVVKGLFVFGVQPRSQAIQGPV
ncbi:hypothetical protein C7974DRAFT_471845 [Boeremia exigua]|uniref:uncharacterized protein n=1 Tax=Boeremia exigua TaxID=749465 RepID=UPI001E8EB4D6|nr:uncharacterized protein C7974DRAFT_471845 [Boeremia exigua]KAH6633787.1 hypothetical protein C7974DRAFT_471845 [Boeremia exigua]